MVRSVQKRKARLKYRNYIINNGKYVCQYCGKTCNSITIDHVIPLRQGGTNKISNMVCACYECNQEKNKIDKFCCALKHLSNETKLHYNKPNVLDRIRKREKEIISYLGCYFYERKNLC